MGGDSLSGSLTRAAGTNAGVYAIQQGTLAANANYTLTYAGDNLTITAAPLTVTADAKAKAYGASDPALTYQVTSGSLVGGDSLSGSLTRALGENAGSYAIQQGSVVAGANYALTYVGANLSITPASLTGTAASASRAYGATNPVFTVNYSGFVGGDTTGVLGGSLVFQCVDTNAAAVTTNTPVGVYPIHVTTGQTAANYGINYADGSLTVTSAVLMVTADAKSRAYGATNPPLTLSYSGFVNGEAATALGGTVAAVTTAQTNSPIGSYAITEGVVTVTNANYSLSFVPGVLTITPYALTVTADAKTKVYGAVDPALTYQITGGLLAGGDSLSGSLTRAAGTNVGSYAIQQGTLTAGTNYTLTYVGANLSITAAPLTVTADAQTEAYGTGDPALTYQVTSGSLVGGDSLSGSLTRVAGTNVGLYPIQQGTLAASANYTLAYAGANLSITPELLTATADAKTKMYGGADPALTYQITSGLLVGGDSLSGSLTRVAGTNVGAYAIQQGTLAASANYALTYAGANLSITAAPLTVTADAKTKVYGASDPALTYLITSGALLGGDSLNGSLARVAGTNAGVYAIQQGTLTPGGNYMLTYVGANLTITAAPLTVTADAKTKVYGASDPALTYQVTSGALVGGDSLSGSQTRVAGTNVGNYAIQQGTLAAGANYALTYVGANLSITAAPLTATADAKTKVYGAVDPALTYQITSGSLVGGDSLSGSLTRVAGTNVGSYPIQQGTLAASANYTLTYAGANLSITVAPLTATADAKTEAYGASDPALTYQITSGSLVGGDSLSGSLTRVAGTNVGSYAIQQGTLAASANYALTYAGANLTITPAPLTATAVGRFKAYGTADPALTAQITSGALVGTDILSGSLTRVAGETVGTYAILKGTLTAGDNYNLTYVGASLMIVSAPLTITADAKTKVYGTSDPALTWQITSGTLAAGESITGTPNRTTGETVGSYSILQGTLTAGTNYTLTYVSANLSITPASLTGTVVGASRAYGATNPVFTVNYTGFVGGDTTGVLSGSLVFQCVDTNAAAVTTNTPAGVYPIHVLTGQTAANYSVAYADGSLTVTSAVLMVTADAKTNVYGAADPVLTYQVTNGATGGNALVSGDSLSGSLTRVAGTNAGVYAILQGTLTASTNYTLTFVGANLQITPAPLTITAQNKTKTQGMPNPPLTAVYSGFVAGEGTNSLTTQVTLGTTAMTGSPAGAYPITASGAVATNYTIGYVGGNLSVLAPPVLSGLSTDGSNGAFTLPTIAGQDYQIETTDSLNGQNWSPLGGPFTGTGGPMTVTNSLNGSPTFFRVRIMP